MSTTTTKVTSAALATEPALETDPTLDTSLNVFEGPEKKLEVFFTRPSLPEGFRCFDEATWSTVLAEARCSILHCQPNAHFDSYLLSESSLFVYPSRVILKTCGTTTLILVLPALLALAKRLGARLDHVHYSRLRYKFPSLQVHPHTSFRTEQRVLAEMLEGHVGAVRARVIGAQSGTAWHALCTEPLPGAESAESPPAKKSRRSHDLDNILELAMEGLPARVCNLFYEDNSVHQGRKGRALARSMTDASGIGALLPADAVVDDWAFEPCGYSMNASNEQYYYTIHITPELAFSYASFETNDPAYRKPEHVAAIVRVFSPSALTLTLTKRGPEEDLCELPTYALNGLQRTSREHHALTSSVSVCCLNYAAEEPGQQQQQLLLPKAASCGEEGGSAVGYDGSEASSDDTFPSEEL